MPVHRRDSPSPSDLRRFDQRKSASLGQVLMRAARLLNEQAVARVQATGVPMRLSHTALLPHLDFGEGTRLTTLAERVGVTKQAAGQLVDTLVAQGIVERVADPEDARARRVRFTRKGLRSLHHGLGVLEGLEHELAGLVGKARTKRLLEDLLVLMSALEGMTPPRRPSHRAGGADPKRTMGPPRR